MQQPLETECARLLAEYEAIEDRIEVRADTVYWELADWLAEHVSDRLPLQDISERRGRTVRWLSSMKKAAEATRPNRLPEVSVRTYITVLGQVKWDLDAANTQLKRKGTRLRDHQRGSESVKFLTESLARRGTSQEDRVMIADALLKNEDMSAAVESAIIRRASERQAERALDAPAYGEVPEPASQPRSPWGAFHSAVAQLAMVMDRLQPNSWEELGRSHIQSVRDDADRYATFLAALRDAADDRLAVQERSSTAS